MNKDTISNGNIPNGPHKSAGPSKLSTAHEFLTHLRRDLQQPLPGRAAQFAMAPRPRPDAEQYEPDVVDARLSSVLVLFYTYHDALYLPLILRPTYAGVHSGQIGLPGGGMEPDDADPAATALRETEEEIGVPPSAIEIIGSLSSLYIAPSNYLVRPFIGWTSRRPEFVLDPREVAALIEVKVADLLKPENMQQEIWQLRDREADVPFFRINDQIIWGATAMILGELLALPAIRNQEVAPQSVPDELD